MAYLKLIRRESVSQLLAKLVELRPIGGTHEDYLVEMLVEIGLSHAFVELLIEELVEAGIIFRNSAPVEELN